MSNKDDEIYDVVVNPNREFIGQLFLKNRKTGELIPLDETANTTGWRGVVNEVFQKEMDAMIREAIRKAVQDAKKDKA